MVAIYVVAGLCIVGMIMIALISMFGGGNSGSAALAQERMERRQAKIEQQGSGDQTEGAAASTPSSSARAFDEAA